MSDYILFGIIELVDNSAQIIQQKIEDIKVIIRPCGLFSQKSKVIHRLSEILKVIL
ncbi:MAG: hypothetical protein JKY48_20615 [Flavobacteriales bacterium]|nr:hypothetical protein [Flavobacteriales bacterium]